MIVDYYEIKKQTCNYMCKRDKCPDQKLNRGSGVTLPGYVARLIDPNILSVMASQIREKTIVTMGTNGKTTTNAILYKALKAEEKP